MTTDFAQLYLLLGIRNDCTLEEFKQACRRRIRQQHPDRLAGTDSPDATQAALPELLALYAKALRFHRRHGRLPGALAPSTVASTTGVGLRPIISQPPLISRPSASSPVTPAAPRQMSWRTPILILAATVVGFAALNAWNESESESTEEAVPATETAQPAITETTPLPADATPAADAEALHEDGQPLTAPPRLIEIGMDSETVRSLQGDPLQWNGSEWIYGPSWIRFERGRVVDWYSSPLHRLKTETVSP